MIQWRRLYSIEISINREEFHLNPWKWIPLNAKSREGDVLHDGNELINPTNGNG